MIRSLQHNLKIMLEHPLGRRQRFATLGRWLRWQIGSRVLGSPSVKPFVEDARLLVQAGMTGATMNLYVGLHEFEDMSFLLHMLREDDLFVDAGANVGTYTVLASKVRGAHSITIEPVPSTYEHLMDNINLNRIQDQVSTYNLGLAAKEGEARFSTEYGPINHVLSEGEQGGVTVPVRTLDSVIGEGMPMVVKIDVEDFEQEVIHGGFKALSRQGLQAMIIEFNSLTV